MVFNKDEMHAPAWMNSAFLEKVLKQSENNNGLNVTECQIVPGTRPGDHFASIIFRAIVKYQSRGADHEVSLIVKTVPDGNGLKRDLLKDGVLFDTEIVMYNSVIPEMHRLLRSVGDDTELGPRLLYFAKEPNVVMVFEDISVQGYSMKDSLLSLSEAKIVYKKMARWHAASVHLANTVPVIKTLNKGLASVTNEEFESIWDSNIGMLAKVIQEWPGYEHFSEKVDNLKKKIYKKLSHIYQLKESNIYNVLNHGDLHYKNMMYKIENGTTKDILLLDYQISVWGSPAIDIIYSLYVLCSTETRENHRGELIKFYYDEFVASLNKFGHLGKIPTLLDLNVEILKCGHLEIFISTAFLPFMFVRFEEMLEEHSKSSNSDEGFEFDFSNKEKMQEMLEGSYRNPVYTAVMQKSLPVFLTKGFLDI
ncbi:uncharacterized protein LOC129731230 [Wyeomyia smithii]|uniref:uncharacterized protein LOC129731230 n=1 Tax=Wyeomyia smithii TaxID=174621 RepID=UPI002467DFDA|nr:uncharacterized protein LOC129731230 [Wyeomyia smithii]